MITILDPTHGSSPARKQLASRESSLAGATVGFISNGKEGTKSFFGHLERKMKASLGVARVEVHTKSSYSAPADAYIMDEASAWAAAVTGLGD